MPLSQEQQIYAAIDVYVSEICFGVNIFNGNIFESKSICLFVHLSNITNDLLFSYIN